MRIACFNIRVKVVLNVKVSRTVRMGADQDPIEAKKPKKKTNMSVMDHDAQLLQYSEAAISKPWNLKPQPSA